MDGWMDVEERGSRKQRGRGILTGEAIHCHRIQHLLETRAPMDVD